MTVPPHLSRKLQETLGADAADFLVAWMQEMDTSRGDIRELRHEMQLGFTRVDARFGELESKLTVLMEKSLREQTRFFFLALSTLLVMIAGLYART